jgi:phosphohistidine phosphatase
VDLYLIRHADALAVGENNVTEDAARPLSGEGETQAQKMARALRKRGVTLDTLVTSPLLRARQTAECMLKVWNGNAPAMHTCDDLAPDSKNRKLARYLRRLGGERIGLVGHMPHIGAWAAWLIGSKKAQIDFAKAGVAHITCGDGPRQGMGVLQWLVTPAWCDE